MGKRGPKKGAANIQRYDRESCIEHVCDITASSSLGLSSILTDKEPPLPLPNYSVFMKWLSESTKHADKYARAKEEQSDYMADEMLTIADKATGKDYNAARLQIDTRKWLASKLKAKKYGDKIDHTVDASLTVNLVQFSDKEENKG